MGIMMANRKTKKEMTEALTLFLNERTEEFTAWLYQMLDNIRKRREKKTDPESKPSGSGNAENNNANDGLKATDELEIGVGPEDDLDNELLGDEEKKNSENSKRTSEKSKKSQDSKSSKNKKSNEKSTSSNDKTTS